MQQTIIENFYSIKAHLLLKNNYQGYCGIGRMLAAILQYNDPDLWIFKLFDYFHLAPLPESITIKLSQIFKQWVTRRALDQSPEFQKKQEKQKAEYKKQLSKENSSKDPLAHPYRKRIDE